MSDELRAAAERILSNREDDAWLDADDTLKTWFCKSVRELATVYLATHLPDDGEPVTGGVVQHIATVDRGDYSDSFRLLQITENTPSWMLEMTGHEPDEKPDWTVGYGVVVETKGELRRLLAALKVGRGT